MHTDRRILGALVALVVTSGSAAAQTLAPLPKVNLEQLELSPSAVGSLVAGSGELLPQGALRLALGLHYERNPLVAVKNGERIGGVISDRLTADLIGAYAIHRRVELALHVPVVAFQTGDDLTERGLQAAARGGLGMPFLSGRLGILSSAVGSPLDLAIQLGVGLPVGTSGALLVDSGAAVVPKLMASRRFGPWISAAEVGALFRPTVGLGPDRIGNQLTIRASLGQVTERFSGELSASSAIPLSGNPAGLELLLGGRCPIGPGVELFAAAGPGFGSAAGIPAFRALAGAALRLPLEQPKPVPVPEPQIEAPPPDPCAPGASHLPAQCPELDDDGDGIVNANDACPTQQGPASTQGCPVLDRDQDGVPDDKDRCPDQPGPAERQGCPVVDTDGDGIEDSLDACPKEAGPAANQGCPVEQKQLVAITRTSLAIQEKIYFDSAKARILPKSFKLLDQVAAVIQSHPDIPRIIVEGHTDNRGDAAVNRRLSLFRAQAVRDYLVAKGINPSRLAAEGYGPDRPTSSNKTFKGREMNRRVEFKIPLPAIPFIGIDLRDNEEDKAPEAPAPGPMKVLP